MQRAIARAAWALNETIGKRAVPRQAGQRAIALQSTTAAADTASTMADGLAIQNFEAAFQLGNVTLAALIGAAAADLQAKPARQQEHDDEGCHGRADARLRRRRRPQNVGMVAKILRGPAQSDALRQDEFELARSPAAQRVEPSTAVALISISASLRMSPATSTPVAAGYGGPLKNSRRTAAVRL